MVNLNNYKNKLFVNDADVINTSITTVDNSVPKLPNGIYGPISAMTSNTFSVPQVTVSGNKITNVSKVDVAVTLNHCSYCTYCSFCANNHCTKCPQVRCSDCTRCTNQY